MIMRQMKPLPAARHIRMFERIMTDLRSCPETTVTEEKRGRVCEAQITGIEINRLGGLGK